MAPVADRHFMAKAIRLAANGRYSSFPNPAVGCVLVRDGQIIGEGWHEKAGEPHAEVIALRSPGENLGASVAIARPGFSRVAGAD